MHQYKFVKYIDAVMHFKSKQSPEKRTVCCGENALTWNTECTETTGWTHLGLQQQNHTTQARCLHTLTVLHSHSLDCIVTIGFTYLHWASLHVAKDTLKQEQIKLSDSDLGASCICRLPENIQTCMNKSRRKPFWKLPVLTMLKCGFNLSNLSVAMETEGQSWVQLLE